MAEDKGTVLPLSRRVRFVFDHNNEKAIFLREWKSYYNAPSEEAKSILAGRPKFQDDNDFFAMASCAPIGLVNTYAS
jgi:hypothetical protein